MRPDIVLLVLDTQRADRLSCYGYERETTPRLDALAHESTRFSRAVAPAQWTVPTHASLFTGLYPAQHTMQQMDAVLPAALPTLAERLAAAGYRTAAFSNNPLIGSVANGLTRGFAGVRSLNFLGAGLLNYHLNAGPPPRTARARLSRAARFWLAEGLGYSQETGADFLAPLLRPLWQAFLHRRGGGKLQNTRRALDGAAQALLSKGADDRPLFAFVNLMGVHVPYDPPRWAVERFLPGAVGRREALRLQQRMNALQVDVTQWLAMTASPETFQAAMSGYYDAETAAQDAAVGDFVDSLREGGALARTLLLVVADHGDHLGDQQRLNHAFGAYEAVAHVPLLVRDPRGELGAGQAVDRPVSTRRLFHTALAAAGAATPEEAGLALAAGPDPEPHVFCEAPPLRWAIDRLERRRPGVAAAHGYGPGELAVYAGNNKLIDGAQRPPLLFDLARDLGEDHDRSAADPERVADLRQAAQRFRAVMQPLDASLTQETEDPEVLQHLRDLGYIE